MKTRQFTPVILESPLAGDVEANVAYARRCVRDCLLRGEAPFASHLIYAQPGVLDDLVEEERKLGMEAGFAWIARAAYTVVYLDRGLSRGMREGIVRAISLGREVVFRAFEGKEVAEQVQEAFASGEWVRLPERFVEGPGLVVCGGAFPAEGGKAG